MFSPLSRDFESQEAKLTQKGPLLVAKFLIHHSCVSFCFFPFFVLFFFSERQEKNMQRHFKLRLGTPQLEHLQKVWQWYCVNILQPHAHKIHQEVHPTGTVKGDTLWDTSDRPGQIQSLHLSFAKLPQTSQHRLWLGWNPSRDDTSTQPPSPRTDNNDNVAQAAEPHSHFQNQRSDTLF